MKNLFKDYNIPLEFQSHEFIQSLQKQYKTRELSPKQLDALQIIVGNIILLKYKLRTIQEATEHYYRTDYHGDYLHCAEIVQGQFKSEMIQDLHAMQYGYAAEIERFTDIKDIEVLDIDRVKMGLNKSESMTLLKNFDRMVEKLQRNKFRKIRTKNECLVAINSVIKETPNFKLIDKVLNLTRRY